MRNTATGLLDAEADLSLPPPFLGERQHAVEDRCLTYFTYKGTKRGVHPYGLRPPRRVGC